MTCVGVPMGSPEFVTAFVRSKPKILQQDVQKLRIVPDPLIHYALLRFCQHTCLAFLARNVPPVILMQPVDVNFDPETGVRTSPVAVPVFIQDLIVSAIPPLPTSSRASRTATRGDIRPSIACCSTRSPPLSAPP